MLVLALEMREKVGCVGVVVDAKAESVPFYAALGFQGIDLISGTLGHRPAPTAMFLSIRQVAVAMAVKGKQTGMK